MYTHEPRRDHRRVDTYAIRCYRCPQQVQYPGLEAQVRADQFTTRFLVGCLGRAFPDFEFSWMLPEFEDNLRLELDFTQVWGRVQRVDGGRWGVGRW